MPEYTVMTVLSVVAVVALELVWLKTGIFRTVQYWVAMAIVFAFQVPVDGWLTKLSAPIVIYNPDEMVGVRAPWDIPIEDFGFGFTMVTLAILLWRRQLARRPAAQGPAAQGPAAQGLAAQGPAAQQPVARRPEGA